MLTPDPKRIAARFLEAHHDLDREEVEAIEEDVQWDLEVIFRALSLQAKADRMELDRWKGHFKFDRKEEVMKRVGLSNKGLSLVEVWMFSNKVKLTHGKHEFFVTIGFQKRVYEMDYGDLVGHPEPGTPNEVVAGDIYVSLNEWPSGQPIDDHTTKKMRGAVAWLTNAAESEASRRWRESMRG